MDGARHALLGYLYQFIGVCNLRATASAFGPQSTSSLLAEVRAGALLHEVYNSDAVVRRRESGSDELVAIQFKHSSDPAAHVTERDLIEIIHGLELTRRTAAQNGQTVTRYFLVTNRALNSEARALVAAQGAGHLPPQLLLSSGPKNQRSQTAAKGPKPRQPKATEKLLAHYKSEMDAATAWWAVLKALTCCEGITFESGRAKLRNYASEHGVLPADLDAGLNRLIGALGDETSTGAVEISEAWLKEHLVGYRGAARLSFPRSGADHIITRCRSSLAETLRLTSDLGEQHLVRRLVQSRLASESAQRTVVFVYGSGGVGKSTEVYRHLLGAELVSIGLRADVATETAIGETFHRLWSDTRAPRMSSNPVDDVEARLATANPVTPRTLLVAVDGVDEYAQLSERKRAVQGLVQRFWADSSRVDDRSTLLVCCRPRHAAGGDVHATLIADWLGAESPGALRDLFGFVEVSDFDNGELFDAAGTLGAAPEERLCARLGSRSSTAPAHSSGLTITSELLDSLRHPVVWGLYAVQDPVTRDRILDADVTALDTLAACFIMRFLRKCEGRGLGGGAHLVGALRSLSAETEAPPPYSRVDLWSRACYGHLSASDARTLHDEATGYGLIRADSATHWRWRHRFVADYLRREVADG